MVAKILKNQYNAAELAEKDPFDIAGIEVLAKYDRTKYYLSIVSSVACNALINSEGFSDVTMQNFGGIGVAEYFYNNEEDPRVKQWSATKDASSKKLKKGDICFDISGDDSLDAKIKMIFGIFREIENHDYEPVNESEVSDSDLVLESKGEVIDFSFYEPGTGEKYFVFEFKHPRESKKVVKKLRTG